MRVLGGDEICLGLEAEEKVHQIDGEQTLVVELDLSADLDSKFKTSYQDDKEGGKCLKDMEQKINQTLEVHIRELMDYFTGLEAVKRLSEHDRGSSMKRSPGVGAALALAIIDLVATGAVYFYTDYRIGLIRDNIMDIEEKLALLMDSTNRFRNNQEYLYSQSKIFGIQKKAVETNWDRLELIHSCDVSIIFMQQEINRISSHLRRMVNAIIKGVLTTDILSMESLLDMTKVLDIFMGTIYRIHPGLLYEYGTVVLRSVSGPMYEQWSRSRHNYDFSHLSSAKIAIFLTFPLISEKKTLRKVNVLSPSYDLRLIQTHPTQRFTFLIDANMSILQLNESRLQIFNADMCLTQGKLPACYRKSAFSPTNELCLKSIFQTKIDDFCLGTKANSGDINIAQGTKGALVETNGRGKIFNADSKAVWHYLRDRECVFLPRGDALSIEIGNRIWKVLPKMPVYRVKDRKLLAQGVISKKLEKMTVPRLENPFVYNDTFPDFPSNTLMVFLQKPLVLPTIITLCVTITVLAIVVCICIFHCAKGTNANGANGGGVSVNVGNVGAGQNRPGNFAQGGTF